MHKAPGFILFITFSIMALCAALVSAFLLKGMTHKRLAMTIVDQGQIRQFATSVPALAQSILFFSAEDLKISSEEKIGAQAPKMAGGKTADSGASFEKMLLEKVLPVVNISQKFNLKEIDKDIPYVVEMVMCAESGKININGLYDLVNKKFFDEGLEQKNLQKTQAGAVKDQRVFATWVFDKIAAITEKPSLMSAFVEHVKQRKLPFNDVTELLAIKEFADCFAQAVFYEPELNQSEQKTRKKIFLTDIFTVSSENDTIQPWLLSPSVCALLDISIKESNTKQSEKDEKAVDLSSFTLQADWQKDWDLQLKNRYDVSFDKIPEQMRLMFATQFSATVFSVIITVNYADNEGNDRKAARVFAILKEKKLPDGSMMYDVIKLYQI